MVKREGATNEESSSENIARLSLIAGAIAVLPVGRERERKRDPNMTAAIS